MIARRMRSWRRRLTVFDATTETIVMNRTFGLSSRGYITIDVKGRDEWGLIHLVSLGVEKGYDDIDTDSQLPCTLFSSVSCWFPLSIVTSSLLLFLCSHHTSSPSSSSECSCEKRSPYILICNLLMKESDENDVYSSLFHSTTSFNYLIQPPRLGSS